jgi:CheY-like chemotaxis protein
MAKELYGLKILVVDDDKDTLELLEWVLKRAGAEVTAVSSAKAAMEALERDRPTILVSDIAMPEEDGLSLMRRIRALPKERGGRIPAVALTAHSMVQDRLQSLRAGFQSHVPKPVVPEELVEVVTSIVHLRARRLDRLGGQQLDAAAPFGRTIFTFGRRGAPRSAPPFTSKNTPVSGRTGAKNVGANRHRSPLRP